MLQRGSILLIARDDRRAERLVALLQRFSIARRVDGLDEACTLLARRGCWSGVVIDLDQCAGSPREAIARLRGVDPDVQLLALSARLDRGRAAESAFTEVLTKPANRPALIAFARRALVRGWSGSDVIADYVDALARTRGLTPRELQLLAYELGGESRRSTLRRLGVTVNTLKTHVRTLLRKCRARSLGQLAATVQRFAMILHAASQGTGSVERARPIVITALRLNNARRPESSDLNTSLNFYSRGAPPLVRSMPNAAKRDAFG